MRQILIIKSEPEQYFEQSILLKHNIRRLRRPAETEMRRLRLYGFRRSRDTALSGNYLANNN